MAVPGDWKIDDVGHVAEHNRIFATQRTAGYLLVRTAADLPAASGDVHVLPAHTLVEIAGTVDLGTNALQLSTGTLLRGHGGDTIVSMNTGGVVRADMLDAAVILREFSVVAPAGPAFVLSGGLDHQLNMFFVGVFGAGSPAGSAGTITGFDVQSIKQCFVDTAAGFVHTGRTRKIFYSETPFYGIAAGNPAIAFADTLDADVGDLVTCYFKTDIAGSVGIHAAPGYRVGSGKLRGLSVLGDDIQALDGLDPSDLNWQMLQNDGIRDSATAGAAALAGPSTTVIATAGAYVPVTGAFIVSEFTERFEINPAGEFVYRGALPALVSFNAVFSVDPTNNVRCGFRATINGQMIAESQTFVEQGQGAGSSPRTGAVAALQRLVDGDRLGMQVANLESATDIEWLAATYVVRG